MLVNQIAAALNAGFFPEAVGTLTDANADANAASLDRKSVV